LSENGSIYAFDYYRFAQSSNPTKVKSSLIFTDICAHFESELYVAKTEQNQIFVWGNSASEAFNEPKELDFYWLNKNFFIYHKIFYKIIGQSFNLKTKFTSNGCFRELFESEFIAKGSFGFIYKHNRKSDNETFAGKVIPFQKRNIL